jgi:O-antigen ligase
VLGLSRASVRDLWRHSPRVLLVFTLGLFAVGLEGYESLWIYHIYVQWYWGLFFSILFSGYLIGEKISWTLLPLYYSVSLSALWLFHWRWNFYSTYSFNDYMAVTRTAAISYASLVILCLAVVTAYSKERLRQAVLLGFQAIALSSTFLVYIEWAVGRIPYARGGLLGNASMNACLIAMILPSFRSWKIWALGAGAVLLASDSSTGLAALGGALVGAIGVWGVGLAGGLVLLRYLLPHADMLGTSGRSYIWPLALSWFRDQHRPWTGMGLGLSQVLLPMIQKERTPDINEYFLWFHSDVLQTVFELGILGISSLLLVYFTVLYRSWPNRRLRAAFFALAVTAALNFPAHSFLHAFWAAFLLYGGLFKERQGVNAL